MTSKQARNVLGPFGWDICKTADACPQYLIGEIEHMNAFSAQMNWCWCVVCSCVVHIGSAQHSSVRNVGRRSPDWSDDSSWISCRPFRMRWGALPGPLPPTPRRLCSGTATKTMSDPPRGCRWPTCGQLASVQWRWCTLSTSTLWSWTRASQWAVRLL